MMSPSPMPRPCDVTTSQAPPPYDVITSSPTVLLRAHEPQPRAGVQQQPRPARTRTQGPGDRSGVQGTRGQGLEQAEVGGREEDLVGQGGRLSAAPRGDSVQHPERLSTTPGGLGTGQGDSAPSTLPSGDSAQHPRGTECSTWSIKHPAPRQTQYSTQGDSAPSTLVSRDSEQHPGGLSTVPRQTQYSTRGGTQYPAPDSYEGNSVQHPEEDQA